MRPDTETGQPSIERAWYIGCTADQVGEAAILVGDRGRIDRLADLLDQPVILPEKRGLRTVTGGWQGHTITATAFGMGAPIAVIVLRELAALGIGVFVRIGTAMVLGHARLGDLLVAEIALSPDGNTTVFTPPGYEAKADRDFVDTLVAATPENRPLQRGRFASFDSFYGTMFPLLPGERPEVATERDRLATSGVLATDMETAPLLTIAQRMGLAAASLCLGTVDAATQEKLPADALAAGETDLFRTSLDGIASFLDRRGSNAP